MINLVSNNNNNEIINIPEDIDASIRETIFGISSPTSRRKARLLRGNQNNKNAAHKCDNPANDNTTSNSNVSTDRMTKLDDSFTPGTYDVICARGGLARNHTGNIDLKNKIIEAGDSYAKAPSKVFKSLIVSSIVDWVRSRSPNGGFVKKMTNKNDGGGVWYEVGDEMAREKVGQALRDLNHKHYKSSMKAKRQRWKKEKQEQEQHQTTNLSRQTVQPQPELPRHSILPANNNNSIPQQQQQQQQQQSKSDTIHNEDAKTAYFLQTHHDTIQSSLRLVQQKVKKYGKINNKNKNNDQKLLKVFTQHNLFLLNAMRMHAQEEE